MAWTAVENFNTYADGDLAGESGGSGWSAAWDNAATAVINVTGVQAYEGAKSIEVADGSTFTLYQRDLTSALTGDGNVFYVAMRRSGISAGGDQTIIFRNIASGSRCGLKLAGGGNIQITGTTAVDVLASYSFDTWYALRVTLNVTAGTATAAYSTGTYQGGGSWSSESSPVTMTNSGNIDRLQINCDAESGTEYIDYISGVDPLPAVGGGSFGGGSNLSLLGVGN